MQQYLDQKCSLADRLRLIGSPISDADLQLFILHGLNVDYDSIVVSLNSRSNVVPFNELSGLLLTHEQRINKNSLAIAGSSTPSFPASLTSSTFAAPIAPQANLVSSSLLGPLPSTDHELMQQFSAFLASKGQWRGKNINKAHYTSSARFLCQLC
jgi:hypothetical protein